jgi:hypothetical protein
MGEPSASLFYRHSIDRSKEPYVCTACGMTFESQPDGPALFGGYITVEAAEHRMDCTTTDRHPGIDYSAAGSEGETP